jgi:hypothetical protein
VTLRRDRTEYFVLPSKIRQYRSSQTQQLIIGFNSYFADERIEFTGSGFEYLHDDRNSNYPAQAVSCFLGLPLV